MRRPYSALIGAMLVLSGCYHVTVTTGAPEAAPPAAIDKMWQNSFVYGLVPPPEIDASQACPNGVAKVETEISFLNGLVGAITWSIYTPQHARITCATGPVRR
jgi:hypothetical protein